jgi:hypothetical protein
MTNYGLTFNEWTLTVRIATLVVSVIAASFVAMQLRQVVATVLGNAYSNSFTELREIHKVFVDHPEMRPYFFNNEVLGNSVSADVSHRAEAIAEMYLDAFFHMYLLRKRLSAEEQKHVDLLIEDMVQRSGVLADYLAENSKFMLPDLDATVSRYIAARAR